MRTVMCEASSERSFPLQIYLEAVRAAASAPGFLVMLSISHLAVTK